MDEEVLFSMVELCKEQYPHFTAEANEVHDFLVTKGLKIQPNTFKVKYYKRLKEDLAKWRRERNA